MVEAIKRFNEARWEYAMMSGPYWTDESNVYEMCLRKLWVGALNVSRAEMDVMYRSQSERRVISEAATRCDECGALMMSRCGWCD